MVRTMATTLFALRRFIITSRSYHPKWLSDTFLHKPALFLAEVCKYLPILSTLPTCFASLRHQNLACEFSWSFASLGSGHRPAIFAVQCSYG